MNNLGLRLGVKSPLPWILHRNFSVTSTNDRMHTCKLLVVGGGSGGCTMAAKFARNNWPKGSVIILEPSKDHYYQPLWTLVGAGVKKMEQTRRDMAKVLPTKAVWLQDSAQQFDPKSCKVTTTKGDVISYEYIIVAVGLKYDYNKIPGLLQALEDPTSGVGTIYDHRYAEKVFANLKAFKGGDAVFTYPDTLIKCPGAPQKIVYLTDSFLSQKGIRSSANITYNTCLPVIFGVKKYADALLKVVERKNINVNYKTVLTEVRPDEKVAVFRTGEGDCAKNVESCYNLLHATPPMSTPDFLSLNKEVTDKAGYLLVDKYTLQSTVHSNVFGIGDCTTTPNSKTAAAIAKQSYVVENNLRQVMCGQTPTFEYNGYGACPLLTSYQTCILAEFLYDGKVHETFPFDQSSESRIAYYMKKDLFPFIYWHFMLKGYYHGPEMIRKIFNPFAK